MLSLDKLKKGISEISESGGIDAISKSVTDGVGNLRDSVTTSVGNLRNSVTAGVGNLRNSVTTGVGNLRNSVRAGFGSGNVADRNRSNLFSAPSSYRPTTYSSSSSSSSSSAGYSSSSKQKVRPGKLSLYVKNISTKRLSVPVKCVGSNIKSTLENILRSNIEGKCSIEGYVKQRSCNVITYSCGIIAGNIAIFTVVFECLVCNPSQGMRISCSVKNITNAGILARVDDGEYSPVNIFIARDHHYNILYFSELKEGDEIMIRVIGQRFELNDAFVSVLGELEVEHQREPRNSLRREIEMSQKEKEKGVGAGLGAGILSTILEETGISESLSEKPAEGETEEAETEEAETTEAQEDEGKGGDEPKEE
jgi:DNA-directed RNA polymerase subunit E'/Rpb7